jgi:TPR repeat protein
MNRAPLVFLLIMLSACDQKYEPKIFFEQGKYAKSFNLWLPLAIKGDVEAQNYVAIHYYLGLGRKRNFKVAKEWFEKAAQSNYSDAQYNLGVMYENGESIKKDYINAYKWFYLANENGNINAVKRMQAIGEEHKLFPNQINHAIELSRLAVNKKSNQ